MLQSVLGELNAGRVVLASASPRRQELLQRMGVTFDVVVSDFAEDLDKAVFSNPADYPLATARAKALDVLRKTRSSAATPELPLPRVIISADSVVLPPGGGATDILEKACTKEACVGMLRQLQGKVHTVITAVVVLFPWRSRSPAAAAGSDMPVSSVEFTESTAVTFEDLDEETMALYAERTEAWMGKAGSYGIQDLAATFIPRIEGDYYNVMGFPVCALCKVLKAAVKEKLL
jgi:septum formation protein